MDGGAAAAVFRAVRDRGAGVSGRDRHRGQCAGLAALGPSWGIVYCSEAAHINTSEANAAGFFGGGLKLVPVAGEHGRVDADGSPKPWPRSCRASCIAAQPAAVNLTQATDLGAVYPLDEIARGRRGREVARPQAAHGRGALRQRGGAARLQPGRGDLARRASTSCRSARPRTAARLCDAIVVFAPELADGLAVQLRRAGQVWSKMRFASAQLMAYIENGLWLRAGAARRTRWRRASPPGCRRFPGPGCWRRSRPTRSSSNCRARVMDALEADGFAVLPPQRDARPLCLPLRRDRGRGRRAVRGAAPASVAASSGASGGVGRYSAASACGLRSGSMPSARL